MADFNEEYYSKEEKRRQKRHDRIVDIIAVVFCLVAAIGIWLVAVNSNREQPKIENESPKTDAVASQKTEKEPSETEAAASLTVLATDDFMYFG